MKSFVNLSSDAIKQELPTNAFDRIILLNCLHQVANPAVNDDAQTESQHSSYVSHSPLLSYIHMLRRALAKNGKLIIVHREPNINTLPLPMEVITNWYSANAHSARLIEQLHRDRKKGLEILWEVETVKFTIQKLVWYNLLIHRSFYPLTLNNQKQVNKNQIYYSYLFFDCVFY